MPGSWRCRSWRKRRKASSFNSARTSLDISRCRLDCTKRLRRPMNGARVVSVSSSGHVFSPVIFDDLNFDFVPYTPFGAYGQSKTANALLSLGIALRWGNEGISSNALNPGAIATGLQKHTGGLKTPVERRKTPEQGAATSVLLAASPLL